MSTRAERRRRDRPDAIRLLRGSLFAAAISLASFLLATTTDPEDTILPDKLIITGVIAALLVPLGIVLAVVAHRRSKTT